MKFTDLTFYREGDRYLKDWEHACASFPNGFGLSVVRNPNSYGAKEGLYECAVMHDEKVCYDSGITDDVLGWQTPADIDALLVRVEALEAR